MKLICGPEAKSETISGVKLGRESHHSLQKACFSKPWHQSEPRMSKPSGTFPDPNNAPASSTNSIFNTPKYFQITAVQKTYGFIGNPRELRGSLLISQPSGMIVSRLAYGF